MRIWCNHSFKSSSGYYWVLSLIDPIPEDALDSVLLGLRLTRSALEVTRTLSRYFVLRTLMVRGLMASSVSSRLGISSAISLSDCSKPLMVGMLVPWSFFFIGEHVLSVSLRLAMASLYFFWATTYTIGLITTLAQLM